MRIETQCIHEGYKSANGEPQVLPICQSTTFRYDTAAELGDLFDLKVAGHFYTRLSNPTLEAVEKKIAALEGGVGAMVTSSGQAASMMSILNICGAGDTVISTSAIYGGTFNLFDVTLRKLGINFVFVDPDIMTEELDDLITPQTKAIFGETVSNPSLRIFDIERFAKVAHKHNIPLIVDNTFATPILCRPIEFGADIVIHSTTKYMDGHAVATGGVIVDSGKFDWRTSGKFPGLCEPDPSYHGLIYVDTFGPSAYILKARVQLMRDLGAQQSPQNAFLLNMNLETLAIRMERHVANALAVAKYLKNSNKIEWIEYPGLESSKDYEIAKKYLPNGVTGVVSYGVKGGRTAAAKFMEGLELASLVIHVADIRTCVLHPASTTHRQLSDEQLIAAGVSPDLIRMSVGLENVDDIISDIDNALAKL